MLRLTTLLAATALTATAATAQDSVLVGHLVDYTGLAERDLNEDQWVVGQG